MGKNLDPEVENFIASPVFYTIIIQQLPRLKGTRPGESRGENERVFLRPIIPVFPASPLGDR